MPANKVSELLDFFQVFADQCHHGKEEGMLFPELEAQGIPREGGPIYYEFHYERSGQFTWEYLEQGPEVWRVRIGKR